MRHSAITLSKRRSSRIAKLAASTLSRFGQASPRKTQSLVLTEQDQAILDLAKSYRPKSPLSDEKKLLMKSIAGEKKFKTKITQLVKKCPAFADKLMRLASAARDLEASNRFNESMDDVNEPSSKENGEQRDHLEQGPRNNSLSQEERDGQNASSESNQSGSTSKSISQRTLTRSHTSVEENASIDAAKKGTSTQIQSTTETLPTSAIVQGEPRKAAPLSLADKPATSPKRKREALEPSIEDEVSNKRQKMGAEPSPTQHQSLTGDVPAPGVASTLAELQSHVPVPKAPEPTRVQEPSEQNHDYIFLKSQQTTENTAPTSPMVPLATPEVRSDKCMTPPALERVSGPQVSSSQASQPQNSKTGWYPPPVGFEWIRLAHTAQCDLKLDHMDVEFDVPINKAEQEFNAILVRTKTHVSHLFRDLTVAKLSKDGMRLFRNLVIELPEAMELITGARYEVARDLLVEYCTKKTFSHVQGTGCFPIQGVEIALAVFNALLTAEVWNRDLLLDIGVFGSSGDPFMKMMEEVYDTVGSYGDSREVSLMRYHIRDTQRRLFNSPKVQAKITQMANKIMEKYELGITAFKAKTVLEPVHARNGLLDCIRRAIILKCRMQLGGRQWEVKWEAKLNSRYDLSRMEATTQCNKAADLGEELIEAPEHRVQLPLTPALWLSMPLDHNKQGLLASERQELIESLPENEATAYSFGAPMLASPAQVIILDGAVEGNINGKNPAVA